MSFRIVGNSPNPPDIWIIVAGWAWILGVVAVSVLYRQSRGLPFFAKAPPNASFVERWASGNSNRHILALIGGASNCLFVALTPDRLIIRPQFPFCLMFLPEFFDLEHSIPRQNILSVAEVTRFFSKIIEIKFVTPSKAEQSVFIKLRDPAAFLEAIRSAK